MEATRHQRTIAAPATMQGVGYWTGRDVRVEFRPAPADTGIVFVRADLEGCPRIPATVEQRVETPRRTVLRCGNATVDMVEHIMAALAGLQVDNCELWVDQPEMPGCDGSSLPFVEVLRTAGIVEQTALRRRHVIRRVDPPGRRGKLDRGPALPLGQDGPPLRARLRQRKPHRPAIAGNFPFAPPLPHESGPQPDVHAGVRGGGDQGPGAGRPDHLQGPVGLRPPRTDRQSTAFPRRVRPPQDGSTWWATSRWPVATWSAGSSPTAAATASTPSWSAPSSPNAKWNNQSNARIIVPSPAGRGLG